MFAKSLMRWPLGLSRPLSMLSSSSSASWTKSQTSSSPSRRGGFLASEAKGVLKDHRHNIFNVSFTQKYKTRLLDSFFFHKSVVRYSKDSSKGGKGDKITNVKENNVDLKSISSDEVFLLEDIKCPHCDFEFKNTGALQNHLDSTGKKGRGGCKVLLRQRNEAEVKAGNLKHICDECGKGFKHKSELEKHNNVHKEKDIKEDWEEEGVKCPHCHIGFANEDILSTHIDLTGTRGVGCKVLWKIKNKADVDAGKLKHVCDFDGCDIGFRCKSELEKHKASHSDARPFVCSECGNSYKLRHTLNKHVRDKHSGQVFECPECDKTFSSKGEVKTHLKICRQEEKDFKCSQCGVKFHTNSHLTKHIKQVHTKERPHKPCDHCDYSCSNKADLEKHILAVHEKARPHQCEDCSAAFSTAGDLKTHRIRHHTFDWPLTCHVCEEQGIVKGFIVPYKLEKHMKAQHPVEHQEQLEREKPAICPVCEKRFRSEMEVGIHIKKKHG